MNTELVARADGVSALSRNARVRNIERRRDIVAVADRRDLETLFSSETAYIFRHRLELGQCRVSNDVLQTAAASGMHQSKGDFQGSLLPPDSGHKPNRYAYAHAE